jgi:hypothetical protein
MNRTCSRDLIFRPAFPDEESRAKYVEGDRSPVGKSDWFVAVTEGVPERIVATIRYGRAPQARDERAGIDFRLTPGPGNELAGQEKEFLSAFTNSLGQDFQGKIRHMPLVPLGHPWDDAFAQAGFEPRYREHYLEAPVAALAARVARSCTALERYPSPLRQGRIVPVRECDPGEVIALLTATGLMGEPEIRAIWETEDRSRLDRDASACFVLDGRILGVVLAADAGNNLNIMAIAVREDVTGTRLWVVPHLMQHLFQATAGHGYEHATFRANADASPTTFNFAKRAGGSAVVELRRWVKQPR